MSTPESRLGIAEGPTQLSVTAFRVIETVDLELFGSEEMGDPVAEIRPEVVAAIVQKTIKELRIDGLLNEDACKLRVPQHEERSI